MQYQASVASGSPVCDWDTNSVSSDAAAAAIAFVEGGNELTCEPGAVAIGAPLATLTYVPSSASYRHARSGVAEAGTLISGLVPYSLLLTVGGTERKGLMNGFSINESLGTTPTKGSIRFHGFEPQIGQTVIIADDGVENYIFRGVISRRKAVSQVETPVIWDCEIIDHRWLMNNYKLVSASYKNIGVNTAINRILNDFTDPALDIRVGSIPSSIGNINILFKNVEVTKAIGQIALGAGKLWELTPNGFVNMFGTYPDGNALSVTSASTDLNTPLEYEESMTQLWNRVIAFGGGSKTTAASIEGAITIDVEDLLGFDSGSEALVNNQVISYTGVSALDGPGQLTGVSGIIDPIPEGQAIEFYHQEDSATGQADMATRLGSGLSGVIVTRVKKDFGSQAEAEEFAVCEITFFSEDTESVSYRVVNRHYHPGKVVNVNLTDPFVINSEFRIQTVQIAHRGDISERSSDNSPEFIRRISARPVIRRTMSNMLKDS
jgi:hypothetical protein